MWIKKNGVSFSYSATTSLTGKSSATAKLFLIQPAPLSYFGHFPHTYSSNAAAVVPHTLPPLLSSVFSTLFFGEKPREQTTWGSRVYEAAEFTHPYPHPSVTVVQINSVFGLCLQVSPSSQVGLSVSVTYRAHFTFHLMLLWLSTPYSSYSITVFWKTKNDN